MTTSQDRVLTIVRGADPLDADELREWTMSQRRERLSRDIVATPVEPSNRSTRGRSRLVAIAALGALTVAGAAAAATTMLGGSAPDTVRAHLAELDAGMPPDLRYNPDLVHARAVAATESGALYAADLRDGGYCIEAATADGRPRGGSCVTAADAAARPIEIIAPLPLGDAPLLIAGHLNDANLTALTATFSGATSHRIDLGLDRYFLIEVPAEQRSSALDTGLELTAENSDGDPVAHVRVPPLRDDGAKLDDRQPIFVSTMSDGTDLTLLLGIEGRVNVAGSVSLDLTYPDGTVATISTRSDGTYRVTLPADRRDDFARAFGVLTARDADGRALATAPVGSVAAWRAHNH
ncbi:MAG: hypothetical protein ABI808_00180 [Pseudonocardiales bacterium]